MRAVWTSKIPDLIANQLPFAIAQTANALASMAADDIREDARRKMDVRSSTFLRFFVRGPSERATKKKPTARLFIGAPKGAKNQDRGNLLVQHDVDGTNTKTPFKQQTMMVPTKKYRQESRNRPRKWKDFRKDLGINTKRGLGRGANLGTGRRYQTYLIRVKNGPHAGKTMLFLRTGTGKRNSEPLYVSAPALKLKGRLRSQAMAAIRIRKSASLIMGREMGKAIASAKQVTSGGGVTSSRLPG
jgi:hypothetical protein